MSRERIGKKKVSENIDYDGPNGCWIWLGKPNPDGYGRVMANGKRQQYVHVFAYEQVIGPVPEGLTIDHLCRNKICCNPWHLEPVSRGENVLRGEAPAAVNARKTNCPKCGREFSVRFRKDRGVVERFCRPCQNASTKNWRRQQKLHKLLDLHAEQIARIKAE